MYTLIKGGIFDTKCDLLVVPCNSNGGISKKILKGLKTDNIPTFNEARSYGDVFFHKTIDSQGNSLIIGYAASVGNYDDGNIGNKESKKKCIEQIMMAVLNYAKKNSLKKINAPLLATGAGKLSAVESFEAMIKPFLNEKNVELCIYARDIDKYENILFYKENNEMVSAERNTRVFISYSRKDKDKVSLFAGHLVQNRYDVWIDVKDVPLGEHIISEIVDGLSKSDIYIIFISHNSNNSKWVSEELNIALTKNIESKKPVIIPVVLDDCTIPTLLTGRLYLDARVAIQDALQQFNEEFTTKSKFDNINLSIPNMPVLSGVVFELSKKTNISIGWRMNEFSKEDLIIERENIQRDLRKKANGILMNFVPLSDFDLQSSIPKYKNGMYIEYIETIPGSFDSSICEKIRLQATVYNPDDKKINELVQTKLDKLNATSLTYMYSIPLQEEYFDKKCIQKIQDNYSIISYDFEDGAMIEYDGNFFISVKCTLEQIFIKLHAAHDFTFSEKAASFSAKEFINWLAK